MKHRDPEGVALTGICFSQSTGITTITSSPLCFFEKQKACNGAAGVSALKSASVRLCVWGFLWLVHAAMRWKSEPAV